MTLATLLLLTFALAGEPWPQWAEVAPESAPLQSRVASLEARLSVLEDTLAKAEVNHARLHERFYTLMTETDRLHADKVALMKERLDKQEGQASGISRGWGILVGIASLVVAIAAFLNARRRNSAEGGAR